MASTDNQLHRNKRRKLDSTQEFEISTDVTSHIQLRNLLTFQQNVNEVKQGQFVVILLVCFCVAVYSQCDLKA
jgi:lipopolysaccharide export system protein LptA